MKIFFYNFWLTVITMGFISFSASGYDFEVDGIRYNVLSHTENTIETTVSENPPISEDGVLIIPDTVEYGSRKLIVTSIGKESFVGQTSLYDVKLSKSLQRIEESAFKGCTSLYSIDGGNVKILGSRAFEECTSLTKVNISDSLEVIGDYTFTHCKKLKRIENASNISMIGVRAFYKSGLTTFTFSEGVVLDKYVFEECEELENLDFLNYSNPLSEGAFQGCVKLSNLNNFHPPVILPVSVFKECNALEIENILLHPDLKEISDNALSGCIFPSQMLLNPNIEVLGKSPFEGFKGDINILDSSQVLSIHASTFSSMEIHKFRLGRNLSTWNFHFPNTLDQIKIGPLVTQIAPPVDATYGSVKKGENLGGQPFTGCYNLREVIIEPSSEELLISGAGRLIDSDYSGGDNQNRYYTDNYKGLFSNCPIQSLSLGRPLKTIRSASSTFKHSDKYSTYYTSYWKDPFFGVETIVNLSVDYNGLNFVPILSSLENLSINFYVEEIPELQECNLKSITVRTPFPPEAKSFSSKTYIDCSLNIPSGEKEEYANTEVWKNFWNINESSDLCCSIKEEGIIYHILSDSTVSVVKGKQPYEGEIYLPETISFLNRDYNMVKIEDYAFKDCYKLISISLPGSLIELGKGVFKGCTCLESLDFRDSDIPLLIPHGDYQMTSYSNQKVVNGEKIWFDIKYHYGYFNNLFIKKLYLGRDLGMENRYDIEEKGKNYYLITAYDGPFYYLPWLKEITIGGNVQSIGPKYAFIEEVALSVNPGSFKKCSAIEKVEVKSSIPPTGAEFSTATYSNATLIVPDNTASLFQVADGWKEFTNIIDEQTASRNDVQVINESSVLVFGDGIIYQGEGSVPVSIYGIDGNCQYSGIVSCGQTITLPKGIYIVVLDRKSIKVKI